MPLMERSYLPAGDTPEVQVAITSGSIKVALVVSQDKTGFRLLTGKDYSWRAGRSGLLPTYAHFWSSDRPPNAWVLTGSVHCRSCSTWLHWRVIGATDTQLNRMMDRPISASREQIHQAPVTTALAPVP